MRLYDWKPFCAQHYQAKLEGELMQRFQEWNLGSPPPQRFKYLLGRVSDEFQWANLGGSYLSAARIRDRGFDFLKIETGCTFKIVRHPHAQNQGYVSERITQSWKADIFAKELELFDTRDFQKGDVDG
jgi:hypothetical protein